MSLEIDVRVIFQIGQIVKLCVHLVSMCLNDLENQHQHSENFLWFHLKGMAKTKLFNPGIYNSRHNGCYPGY